MPGIKIVRKNKVASVKRNESTHSEVKETLENLQVATQILRRMQKEELKELKIRFLREGQTTEFAIWNLINGPISDAIYHAGQVVSFRRTAGNPIPKGVNVFLGIKQ